MFASVSASCARVVASFASFLSSCASALSCTNVFACTPVINICTRAHCCLLTLCCFLLKTLLFQLKYPHIALNFLKLRQRKLQSEKESFEQKAAQYQQSNSDTGASSDRGASRGARKSTGTKTKKTGGRSNSSSTRRQRN